MAEGESFRIGLLGPVAVAVNGVFVEVTSMRQRRLLASLALRADRLVSEDELIDRLWTDRDDQPANPRAALQTYVSRLRTQLGSDAIAHQPPGYVLRGTSVWLDSDLLETGLVRVDELHANGDSSAALDECDQMLSLVRGPVLGELADEEWARPDALRLEEMIVRAREARLRVSVDAGLPDAISQLEGFVAAHPLREQAQEQLARALYADGRHAEALRRLSEYRRLLSEELGLEPGPAVAALERQILEHDPGLAVETVSRTIAGYRLGEQIASGSFGAVYRAEQPSVGREVAIKVVRPELANDPDFVRRFEAEAQTVARLEHPHIVPLYDYWRDHGGAYLVMRWIRGGSAEQKLVRDGPWLLDDVARLVNEVGAALAVAHQSGVIHRDVKPANILIDETGNSYLTDFGIAVDASADATLELGSAGSPLYVAPELLSGGSPSIAADIYSLGIVLHELLTGRVPYGDSESVEVLSQRKTREPVPSVRGDRPELPEAVDAVIATATQREPGQRFASMGELVLAFRHAVGGALVGAASTDSVIVQRPRQALTETLVGLEMRGVQPYKGLAAFTEADAEDFYGRGGLVDELVSHLDDSRFLIVTGPSGSGKSSTVRAGLVPRMRQRGMYVATIIPGAHPMDEVETALERLAIRSHGRLLPELLADERGLTRCVKRILPDDESELLLVIDQFEELFTLAAAEQRDGFLAALATAVDDPRSRLRVVGTLRADFYDRPLQHAAIAELVRANTAAVTTLTGAELEAAISRPAARVGVSVEPALVAELLREVGDEPAALPLLQYALTETFERRTRDVMDLAVYEAIGGISGALANRADEVANQLDRAEEIRRLFTRLITLGEGVEDTRRRVVRSEIGGVGGEVIDAFGEARLLTFDHDPATREPTVEVAHEALIREWPRLRIWLTEDRDGLRLLRHLGQSAEEWISAGRPEEELYRGGRLEAAEDYAAQHEADLSDLEREYLTGSVAHRERELEEERLRIRRLRRLLATVAVVAAVALVAGVVAIQSRRLATERADEAQLALGEAERSAQVAEQRREQATVAEESAETRRLASEAGFRVQADRQVGLLLAVEAYNRDPGPETLGGLQRALAGLESYLGSLDAGTPYAFVDWLGEDRIVAAGVQGIALLDVSTGAAEARWDIPVRVFTLNPGDGALTTRTLVSVAAEHIAFVPLEDTRAVRVLGLDGELDRLITFAKDVDGLELSPDGRTLATLDADDQLRLHDVDTGAQRWSISAHPETTVGDLALPEAVEPYAFYVFPDRAQSFTTEKLHHRLRFTSDGREVISQESVLRRWDVTTGEQVGDDIVLWRSRPGIEEVPIISHPLVTYLGDVVGTRAIVHDMSGVTSVDLVAGEVRTTAPVGQAAEAYGLAKVDTVRWTGSEGAWVLLTNGRLLHIDLATGQLLDPAIDTQMLGAADLAISPSGRRGAVVGAGGVSLFGLDGSRVLARAVPRLGTHVGSVTPDGTIVTQDYADGSEWFRPGQVLRIDGEEPVELERPDELLLSYSAGAGPTFKAMTRDFVLRLYDLKTLKALGPALEMETTWSGQAGDSENRLMAAGTGSQGIRVYEIATGTVVAELHELGDFVASLSFSPDGQRMAAAAGDGPAAVYDTSDWSLIDTELGEGGRSVVSLRYSPDGRWLVTMDGNGDLALRDPVTHEIERQLVGSGSLDFADGLFFFDESGGYLVTAADGTAQLWDLENGVPIGDPFPNDANNRIAGADGSPPRFVTAVGNHRLIWEIDVESWPAMACRVAGRNMTEAEWEQFGPSGGYHKTCEQWPSAVEIRRETIAVAQAFTGESEVEKLAIRAAEEARAAIEAGDLVEAERVCEEWAQRLHDASNPIDKLDGTGIAGNDLHPFWTIVQGIQGCAGQSFDAALAALIVALERPDAVCGGYPSPCPQSRG